MSHCTAMRQLRAKARREYKRERVWLVSRNPRLSKFLPRSPREVYIRVRARQLQCEARGLIDLRGASLTLEAFAFATGRLMYAGRKP